MICMKNIGLYSIAGLAYFIIGYNLMYVGVGRDLTLLGLNFGEIIGTFTFTYGSSAAEAALLEAEAGASAAGVLEESTYSSMSDWFFQMVFVATTASIVSGALAERVKMWSFFLFTLFLTAFTYPPHRRVDMGRRLAGRPRLHRLCRLDYRPTAPAAGRRWRASSSSALALASSAATEAFGPRRPPTFLSSPLASSSSGSAGSGSTAGRSLPSAAPSTPSG